MLVPGFDSRTSLRKKDRLVSSHSQSFLHRAFQVLFDCPLMGDVGWAEVSSGPVCLDQRNYPRKLFEVLETLH